MVASTTIPREDPMKAYAPTGPDQPATLVDPPDPIRVEDVAEALRSHNIEAIIADTRVAAREVVLALIPDGAVVHSGKSRTLEDIGVYDEIVGSGRYDALRPRMAALDRATQGAEI